MNNCFIEIDSSEPPIMDGSSKFFVESLKKVGLKKQNEYLEEYVVENVINHVDESGSEIIVIPSKKPSIKKKEKKRHWQI